MQKDHIATVKRVNSSIILYRVYIGSAKSMKNTYFIFICVSQMRKKTYIVEAILKIFLCIINEQIMLIMLRNRFPIMKERRYKYIMKHNITL